MPLPTITVIGSLNSDLVTRTTHFPKPGETVISKSFSTGCGGKGANQAVACARLSRPEDGEPTINVKMIGAVGDDHLGGNLLTSLKGDGIDTSDIKVTTDHSTGTAVIIVEEDSGENRILVTPGANYSLQAEIFRQLPAPKPDLIVLQLEIPVETVVQIIRAARKAHIDVLLNPAPAVSLPDDVYKDLQHLVMNESEAGVLSQLDRGDLPLHKYLNQVSEKCHKLGVINIIITLGAYGVFFSVTDCGENRTCHIPAVEDVEVVDTTAAGDSFVGAYAIRVVRGESPEEAVRWANRAAAKTVGRKGAQDAIPWLDELD